MNDCTAEKSEDQYENRRKFGRIGGGLFYFFWMWILLKNWNDGDVKKVDGYGVLKERKEEKNRKRLNLLRRCQIKKVF